MKLPWVKKSNLPASEVCNIELKVDICPKCGELRIENMPDARYKCAECPYALFPPANTMEGRAALMSSYHAGEFDHLLAKARKATKLPNNKILKLK